MTERLCEICREPINELHTARQVAITCTTFGWMHGDLVDCRNNAVRRSLKFEQELVATLKIKKRYQKHLGEVTEDLWNAQSQIKHLKWELDNIRETGRSSRVKLEEAHRELKDVRSRLHLRWKEGNSVKQLRETLVKRIKKLYAIRFYEDVPYVDKDEVLEIIKGTK